MGKKLFENQHCPQCGSFFFTEEECESCGIQFKYDNLGVPLGDKTFYDIKEKYLSSLPLQNKLFPNSFAPPKLARASYHRNLQRRFSILTAYFCRKTLLIEKHKNLFFVEYVALIDELISLDEKCELLLESIATIADIDIKNHLEKWVLKSNNQNQTYKIKIPTLLKRVGIELIIISTVLILGIALFPLLT